MEKKINNSYRKRVLFTIFATLCFVPTSQSYQNIANFDSLFPATWYQKGLEASLSVWQILAQVSEKNNDEDVPFYEMLGKMTFMKFCVSCMVQEGVVCLPEDVDYLMVILNKVKELVDMLVVTSENSDFVSCVHEIILNVQQKTALCSVAQ